MRSIRAMSFNPTTGGRGTFFFHPFLRKKGGGEEREKKRSVISRSAFSPRRKSKGRTGVCTWSHGAGGRDHQLRELNAPERASGDG
ncbi:hypothetical protein ACOMHN_017679 [Nucella lapillus]